MAPYAPASSAPRRAHCRLGHVGVHLFAVLLLARLGWCDLRAAENEIRYEVPHLFDVKDPQFPRSMGDLLGPGILPGNRIKALQNGVEIFPAMLEAIHGAQHSIDFETYIYWSGDVGRKFGEALCDRARAGVEVHVMLDWLGSGKIDKQLLRDMSAAGVQVQLYHPLRWYNLGRLNNRTHRKLLIVDGRTGFTGGVGIADIWDGNADSKDHWRDSHYQVEGPAVAQMQNVFIDNWIKTRNRLLIGTNYFPELKPVGRIQAQVFKSSRLEGSQSIRLMYLLSLASAAQSIRLQSAYFVPDDLTIQTFISARKRGVTVEIIVPGPTTDSKLVEHASHSLWGPLLDAGVRIYEYQPTMYHCKVLIVDDLWVSVGSTNFDDRSFRLNEEANLNIYDDDFAAEQTRVFEDDKRHSRLMTRSEFKHRSMLGKCFDHLAAILRPQL